MVERWMDVGSGVFDIQRGETAQKETTATESALRKESGDARHEVNIKMGEQIYLKDLGKKCLSHIDQFATTDDIVEVVGIQQAMNLITASPADLPGGYNFTFKGSDRVSSTLIKQRNWREVAPVLLSIPNILPGKLAEKLLQVFELNDFETSEMILPDELVMMLQMAAGQQEREAEQAKGTDGKTQKKSRTNNTTQTAISSGAASR
jgi:hypothetical protein